MNFSSRIINLRNTIRVIYEYRLDSIVYFFFLVFLPRVEYEFFTYRKHAKNESSRISIFPPPTIVHFFPTLLILPHVQYEFFRVLLNT